MSFTEKIENAIDKARNKFDEAFPEEKQEEYRVKINNTINELDKKLDTAFDKAKTKIDESLTEEKKAEYKEKADKAMEIYLSLSDGERMSGSIAVSDKGGNVIAIYDGKGLPL